MEIRLLTVVTQITAIAIIVAVALLFAGVGVLVLLHVCVVGRAFRRGLSTVAVGEGCRGGGPTGMSPEDIARLPCFEFGAGAAAQTDCAVCLEGFEKGDWCRLLPACGHSFHAACVDSWIVRAPLCPMCRASVRRPKAKEGLEDGVGFIPVSS